MLPVSPLTLAEPASLVHIACPEAADDHDQLPNGDQFSGDTTQQTTIPQMHIFLWGLCMITQETKAKS